MRLGLRGNFRLNFFEIFKKIERSKISENLLRYCMRDTVRRWTLLTIFECSTEKFFAKDFLYYGVSSPEFSEQFLSSWKLFFLSDLNRLSCTFLSDRKGKFSGSEIIIILISYENIILVKRALRLNWRNEPSIEQRPK